MTVDKDDAPAGPGNGRPELSQRRDRLAALKSRRQTVAECVPLAAPAAAVPPGVAARAADPAASSPGADILALLSAGKGPVGRPGGMLPARPAGAAARPKVGPAITIGPLQKQVLAMAYQMLTQTPADDRGQVEGTRFTVTGVERLMTLLSERSAAQDAPGSKAAGAALAFIGAREGEANAVAGASAEKLVLLARRIEALQSGARQG